MIKRIVVLGVVLGCVLVGAAQKSAKSGSTGEAVNKAHLQKIWDAWSTLDPANAKQYYAQGPHVFFDIAPLKYASWDEYQAGVVKVLADYKSGKCSVNDDAQIHKAGDAYWATATVACEMVHRSGKIDMANFRWTAVFEKHDGKWLTVHEHVSAPES